MPRTFLIDTDTASDDAVALIMALRRPDVRVAAITVVAGNVPVLQATRNALYTVELCGANVPAKEAKPKIKLMVIVPSAPTSNASLPPNRSVSRPLMSY